MKKVQIFIKEYRYGGIEKQVRILANALCSIYDIEIVVLERLSIKCDDINKKVKITYLNAKYSSNVLFKCLWVRSLKEFIRRKKVDTIISTDIIFNEILGKYASDSNLIYWEYKLNMQNYATLEKSLNNFNRVVLPNEFMKDCYTIKNCEVSIIPLTFESIPLKASELNSNNILALGRLNKNKCYDELIEVMDLIHKRNNKIRLNIIGDGEERKELEKIVSAKKLDKIIGFKGFLDKEAINELMQNSSLFVSCAKKESFGVSIIEAMSYGIPCISFDHTSLRDFIKNEINGYLISNRDKGKMADVIIELMQDRKLRQSIGNCARETSIIYDINSVKSEWLKII